MSAERGRVVIGMDPHKRSVTVEVMAANETVLGGGRYATGRDGYRAMLACVKRWPDRVWAIEGCQGIGRHVALRLLRDGEGSSTSRRSCRRGRGCPPRVKAARH